MAPADEFEPTSYLTASLINQWFQRYSRHYSVLFISLLPTPVLTAQTMSNLDKKRNSPNWYAQFFDSNGDRISRSTGSSKKRESEKIAAKLEANEFEVSYSTTHKTTRDISDHRAIVAVLKYMPVARVILQLLIHLGQHI